MLVTEASLANILIGSDTSSTVMTNIFYHLLSNPTAFEKLRKEIDSEFPLGAEIVSGMTLTNMKYLNAVMYVSPSVMNSVS